MGRNVRVKRAPYNFVGTTIREAMREVLIDAQMPLSIGEIARRISAERKRRRNSTKPMPSASIDRAAGVHPEVFFKFGPFVALQEWDQPEDYARFIECHRGGALSASAPVGTTTPPQVAQQQQQQQHQQISV